MADNNVNFEHIFQDTEALMQIVEAEREAQRLAQEAAAEAKSKQEERVRKEKEAKEAEAKRIAREKKEWEEGFKITDIKAYQEGLNKGFRPTAESLGVNRRRFYDYSMEFECDFIKTNFSENKDFPEILTAAFSKGLGKDEATKLLQKAFTSEIVNVLVENGADIQKYPLEDMADLYAKVTAQKKHVFEGHRDYPLVEQMYRDDKMANTIEHSLQAALKSGYDYRQTPQTIETLNSFLKNIKNHHEILANEEKQQAKERAERAAKISVLRKAVSKVGGSSRKPSGKIKKAVVGKLFDKILSQKNGQEMGG